MLLAQLITRALLGGQVDMADHDGHMQQFLQSGLPLQVVWAHVQQQSWCRSDQAGVIQCHMKHSTRKYNYKSLVGSSIV